MDIFALHLQKNLTASQTATEEYKALYEQQVLEFFYEGPEELMLDDVDRELNNPSFPVENFAERIANLIHLGMNFSDNTNDNLRETLDSIAIDFEVSSDQQTDRAINQLKEVLLQIKEDSLNLNTKLKRVSEIIYLKN